MKIILPIMCLFALAFAQPIPAFADIPSIISEHFIIKCVSIVNLTDFPEITLILIDDYKGQDKGSRIEKHKCLPNANFLSLYYIKTKNLGSIDLGHLRTKKNPVSSFFIQDIPADLEQLMAEVPNNAELAKNSNPVTKEEIEFTLYKGTDGSYKLYESKRTSFLSNGTSNRVVTHDPPTLSKGTSPEKPTKSPTAAPAPVNDSK